MGMTRNQLKLIESVAKNDTANMRSYAIACCAEDTTQKNRFDVKRCMDLLNSTPKLIELPPALQGSVVAEDLSEYRGARYYLSSREKDLLERIRKIIDPAIKCRFTTHHEVQPLSMDENKIMITNLLNDAQFAFDEENVANYVSSENCGKTQAEILSHVIMRMADALIENRDIIL